MSCSLAHTHSLTGSDAVHHSYRCNQVMAKEGMLGKGGRRPQVPTAGQADQRSQAQWHQWPQVDKGDEHTVTQSSTVGTGKINLKKIKIK